MNQLDLWLSDSLQYTIILFNGLKTSTEDVTDSLKGSPTIIIIYNMYKSTDTKQSMCNTFISHGYTYNFYTKIDDPVLKDTGIVILSKIKIRIIPDIEYSMKSIRRARKLSMVIGDYSIVVNVNPLQTIDGYHFYINEKNNKGSGSNTVTYDERSGSNSVTYDEQTNIHHSHTVITDDMLLLEKRR